MKVTDQGVYSMDAADYHADPTPEPSLSASLAHVLISQSPKHAWTQSRRLNPDYVPEQAEHFDIGTACHSLLLEGDVTNFHAVDAKDWRTKEAQTQRDWARANGKLPLLSYQMDKIQAMAAAVKEQLDRVTDGPIPFTKGRAEETLVWKEGDVWCRARLDWLHASGLYIDDLKSVGGSANPDQWIRSAFFGHGCDLQAAFYLRGVRVMLGAEATFRFIVCETSPPYAVSIISPGPDVMVLAEKKRLYALEQWARCLRTGQWPSYTLRTHHAGLPPWLETAWLEQEMREAEA